MPARSRERFDLSFLAGELESARVNSGFEFFHLQEVTAVLQSAFPFVPEIPRNERGRILNRALALLPVGRITSQSLDQAIRRAEREFITSPTIHATLVTAISIQTPAAGGNLLARRRTIRISRVLPSRFLRERSSAEARVPEEDVQPRAYSMVRVRTGGRSIGEAFERGLRELDLVRATWNLDRNRRTLAQLGPGAMEPVNEVRLGRVHTLHSRDGALLQHGHWFEPTYMPRQSTAVSAAQWSRMSDGYRRVSGLLARHPYRNALEEGLVRYCRALDSADFEGVLLKLWSVLEFLSDSGGDNYDVMIRRAIFLFQDRRLTRQVLEHLRDQRNLAVHGENGSEHLRSFVLQLKRFVEQFFAYHFGIGRRVGSLSESAALLDLSADPAVLRRQIELRRRALRFIS